jgi:hypothetical protein
MYIEKLGVKILDYKPTRCGGRSRQCFLRVQPVTSFTYTIDMPYETRKML